MLESKARLPTDTISSKEDVNHEQNQLKSLFSLYAGLRNILSASSNVAGE